MRRSDKQGDGPRIKFKTCGKCADGWYPIIQRVTTWLPSGNTHKERLERVYPMPQNYEAKDRSVRHYSAVEVCQCFRTQIQVEAKPEEDLVPMPAKIRDARLGDVVKLMPKPERYEFD